MKNVNRRDLIFAPSIISSLITNNSNAQSQNRSNEVDWDVLSDDVSRATLFRDEVIPEYLRGIDRQTTSSEPLALPDIFRFPNDAREDRIAGTPRTNSIFGIDISHHNSSNIRLDLLRLQRVHFAYVKCTQGVKFKDGLFGQFWRAMGNLSVNDRIYRGAYHFLTAADPGRDQADSFVNYLNLHGGLKASDLLPVVDLEWDRTNTDPDRWRGRGADNIIRTVVDFASRVQERTGKKPMIYTARSWFSSETIPLNRFSAFADFPIWIADYNPRRKLSETPAVPSGVTPVIWQFTDRAQLTSGYDRGVDASIFYGSVQDFNRVFQISP
jgi:lysozyme